jgi:hypothetical protein
LFEFSQNYIKRRQNSFRKEEKGDAKVKKRQIHNTSLKDRRQGKKLRVIFALRFAICHGNWQMARSGHFPILLAMFGRSVVDECP